MQIFQQIHCTRGTRIITERQEEKTQGLKQLSTKFTVEIFVLISMKIEQL